MSIPNIQCQRRMFGMIAAKRLEALLTADSCKCEIIGENLRTNPIKFHVETIQRLFYKSDKLNPFDMEFLLMIETVLNSQKRD